jgi:hypothetical protein
MKFLLIGREATTRPYVTKIDVDTVTAALAYASEMNDETRSHYVPDFLFNEETNECLRVVRAKGSDIFGYSGPEYEINDTAFSIVGVETPDGFMIENETSLEGN